MSKVAPERFSEWHQEAAPLFRRHWEEVANWKDAIQLAPDTERIIKMEREGLWHSWTARSEGKLVGYLCMVVSPMLHYCHDFAAFVDVIYVVSEARRTGAGLRLIRAAEQAATALGAARIMFHSKIAGELDLGPMLEPRGYVWTEKQYERLLKAPGQPLRARDS